ncbi:MAG: hypothetical protein ACF8QF_05070 [Phycisphaerales bacterium]
MSSHLIIEGFDRATSRWMRSWYIANYFDPKRKGDQRGPAAIRETSGVTLGESHRAWLRGVIFVDPDFDRCEYRVSGWDDRLHDNCTESVLSIDEYDKRSERWRRAWWFADYDAAQMRAAVGEPPEIRFLGAADLPTSSRDWLRSMIGFDPDFDECDYQTEELGGRWGEEPSTPVDSL